MCYYSSISENLELIISECHEHVWLCVPSMSLFLCIISVYEAFTQATASTAWHLPCPHHHFCSRL